MIADSLRKIHISENTEKVDIKICNSGIILKLDKPKQKNTIFMFCSDMSELLIVTDCHRLQINYKKFNKL
jgi:hypothetical protein